MGGWAGLYGGTSSHARPGRRRCFFLSTAGSYCTTAPRAGTGDEPCWNQSSVVLGPAPGGPPTMVTAPGGRQTETMIFFVGIIVFAGKSSKICFHRVLFLLDPFKFLLPPSFVCWNRGSSFPNLLPPCSFFAGFSQLFCYHHPCLLETRG